MKSIVWSILILFSVMVGSPAMGQPASTDLLAEVEVHLAAGRYESAIRLLEEILAASPQHPRALRLLARSLYWSGDLRRAHRSYEQALRSAPQDMDVRLEAARFFLETGRVEQAEQSLQFSGAESNADALTLMGTIQYWDGDWTSAKTNFNRALQIQPDHAEARRQINEIIAATPSRLTLAPEIQSDNQPIKRTGAILGYSIHPNPLSRLSVEAGTALATAIDTSRTFTQGSLSVRYHIPRSPVFLDARGGALQVSDRKEIDWEYRIGVFFRLPRELSLSAHYSGRPYFETIPSFSVPVSVTSWSVVLDRPKSDSWIGQAAFESIRYFDGNIGTTLSAWMLFPVSRSASSELRLGYGLGFQNTSDARFDQSAGVYTPYYTPLNIVTHSVLVSGTTSFTRGLVLRANGSYGLLASEDLPASSTQGGPMIPGPPSQSTKDVRRRSFSPWQARIGLDFSPPDSPLRFLLVGQRFATAYYQVSAASLSLEYQFPVQLH